MMESLPHDVTQHILSFATLHRLRSVCSKWNRFCNQNEANYLRDIYQQIECCEHGRKYVIHERRSKLHFVEQALGFVSIHHSLSVALELAKSGDAIFMFDGHYKLPNWTHCINKDVCMVGLQRNAIVLGTFHLQQHCNVRFQNISLIPAPTSLCNYGDLSNTSACKEEMIHVGAHSMLTLQQCRFKFMTTAITVETNGSLISDDCEYEGGCVAIQLSSNSTVAQITRCLFRNCGNLYPVNRYLAHRGCIVISDRNQCDDLNMLLKLKCLNNEFENNFCPSVVVEESFFQNEKLGGYELSLPKKVNKPRCPIYNEFDLNYNHRSSDCCKQLKHGSMIKVAIF